MGNVASLGNPGWGSPNAFALAFLCALALSLAFARVPAQCCCIGLEGLPLLVEVVLLALGLVVRLLTLAFSGVPSCPPNSTAKMLKISKNSRALLKLV